MRCVESHCPTNEGGRTLCGKHGEEANNAALAEVLSPPEIHETGRFLLLHFDLLQQLFELYLGGATVFGRFGVGGVEGFEGLLRSIVVDQPARRLRKIENSTGQDERENALNGEGMRDWAPAALTK